MQVRIVPSGAWFGRSLPSCPRRASLNVDGSMRIWLISVPNNAAGSAVLYAGEYIIFRRYKGSCRVPAGKTGGTRALGYGFLCTFSE